MKKLSLFFILSSLFFHLSYAQLPDIEFEHYTSREGLGNDFVMDIVQDDQGFLWFSTGLGIAKFDGYSFTNFDEIDLGATSGTFSNIISLLIDSNGLFWIGSYGGGIITFNPITEESKKIHHYQGDSSTYFNDQITDIVEDQSGNIWVATEDGLERYDPKTGKSVHFEHIPDDRSSLSSNAIKRLFIDHDRVLWVGTGNYFTWQNSSGGLNRYIPSTQSFKRYNLKNNNIMTIAEDTKGTMYLGTGMDALYRYDRLNDRFKLLPALSSISQSKHNFKNTTQSFQAAIIDILQTGNNDFWVTTATNGLFRLDSSISKGQQFYHDPDIEGSISSNALLKVFQDKQENIWLGTFSEGVNKVIPSKKRFHQLSAYPQLLPMIGSRKAGALFEDRQNNMWVGLENGDLYRFNDSGFKKWNIPHLIKNTEEILLSIYQDSQDRIWISGSGYGLIQFSPTAGIVKRYIPDEEDETSLSGWALNSMAQGKQGHLWLGGQYSGVSLFKPDNGIFINYRKDLKNPRALSNDFVSSVLKDASGHIWIGTLNGLNRYNEETDDFDHFFQDIKIINIIEDKKGQLWLGTTGSGLIMFNPQTAKYQFFTEKNGLLSNFTNNIIEDNEGHIWIGSPAGLTRFEPENKTFVSFEKRDGVDNLFNMPAASVAKLKSGEIMMGGTKGITSFSPKEITANNFPPDVIITDVKSFKNSIKKNGILGSAITLEYDQNDLTFEYVGLHYTNPIRNIYAVKLEPYETEWQQVGTLRQARYTNLSPGQYTFFVKAANSDGIWNEEGKKLSIIINPPLWATWWAYVLYVLVAFGLLYSVRRFELRRRLLQAENKRKTEELEEARQLQLSMLPKELPQLPHLDIAVYMQTATEVGGDYYDFNVSMDATLTVVIGDATGHGMKAGTMVTTAKSLFKTHAANPDILFSFQEFTRCIKDMNFGRTSMCLTMLKISDNTLQISTAGMPPTYIYRSESGKVEEYLFKGMPLGAMEKFPYELKETKLKAGDTILLLSDGLPELENINGEMYGYPKVLSAFEAIAEKTPELIIDHLKNAGASWVNNKAPDDDVTFVVIKVK